MKEKNGLIIEKCLTTGLLLTTKSTRGQLFHTFIFTSSPFFLFLSYPSSPPLLFFVSPPLFPFSLFILPFPLLSDFPLPSSTSPFPPSFPPPFSPHPPLPSLHLSFPPSFPTPILLTLTPRIAHLPDGTRFRRRVTASNIWHSTCIGFHLHIWRGSDFM